MRLGAKESLTDHDTGQGVVLEAGIASMVSF